MTDQLQNDGYFDLCCCVLFILFLHDIYVRWCHHYYNNVMDSWKIILGQITESLANN